MPITPLEPARILQPGLTLKPDAEALVSLRARWTWRALDEASSRLAGSYLEMGLKPGDPVASLMPNRSELMLHYLACLKAGLVATPLNYRYRMLEVDHALQVSDARILLVHDERREELAQSRLVGALPLGTIGYSDDWMDSEGPFADLVKRPLQRDLPAPPADAPAVIFFTSGSTGPAKGVTHSHRTLGWNCASVIQGYALTADDVTLPGSFISHIGGYLTSLAALGAGARVLEARRFDPGEILPLIREERPTVLSMVPVALFELVLEPGITKADLASTRLFVAGGDKTVHQLYQAFMELAPVPVAESYGMTEIGFATVNRSNDLAFEGSVGQAMPGYAFDIRDDGGRPVPVGQPGNLWVKSPGTTLGYWNDAAATAQVLQDGWFDTGDLLRVDETGFYWFHGRKKQIIVHDASNICPQEVEEALLDHPSVAKSGVVGVHDLVHGENVQAYVSLHPGAEVPRASDLIAFARERVGYKAPEEVVILDDLPLNPTGKVDRVTLKRMAADQHKAGHQEDHTV
ncbi:MAG: class I adenylate-forming enzyme family protein [Pseudomonadota bacterium]